MRVTITELMQSLGLEGTLYWGKRMVRSLIQPGQFKSHSVVAHWNEPGKIRLDLRAGASGKKLSPRELANYPLQLQSETFFELDVENGETGDTDDGQRGRGSASGGGASLRSRQRETQGLSDSFARLHADDNIPTTARLSRGVVMGMEVGRDALDQVFTLFCEQIQHARVLASDLLASAGKAVTRYTPPAFMAARGDEDKVYHYNRERNEPMFGAAPT